MLIEKTFTNGADSYFAKSNDTYQLDFLNGNDWLGISAGTTTAHMGAGNDYVRFIAGSATLFGEDGSDRFNLIGSGAVADGGAGDDVFGINGGSNLNLQGGVGSDRFNFLKSGLDESISGGDGNDRFLGNGLAISGTLSGGAGSDAFYGFGNIGGLHVTLAGGTGNDYYRIESASAPTVVENAHEGTDTVELARGLSYVLGANVEYLRVNASLGTDGDTFLTGNGLNNRITGSDGRDFISGLGGVDRLYGYGGDDTIDGGVGNDFIIAGAGDDRITGGLGGDTMTADAGADTFVYQSAAEAPYDPMYMVIDWITNWDEADRIDVSAIDANSAIEGIQHFQVVAADPYDNHEAGTIYFSGDPAGWGWVTIAGYIDGDEIPDFFMLISEDIGYPPVTTDSFITG